MIKLIIFDIDGTLVSTKELHFEALNKAITKVVGYEYTISYSEHIKKYDGLSTKSKLKLLTKEKGLNPVTYDKIWNEKQLNTFDILHQVIKEKDYITVQKTLAELSKTYKLVCTSNAISMSAHKMLDFAGLSKYIDKVYSNEMVINPKPHPEIYIKCMSDYHVAPKECLIIEDSSHGLMSAYQAGGIVIRVNGPKDITCENILPHLNKANNMTIENLKPKWVDRDLNILIPAAGAGSRFQNAGYTFPKPLIDIAGKTMIHRVVDNLNIDGKYTFIVQKEHYLKYNLYTVFNLISPNCDIVIVDGLTEGAACTCLLAKDLINNDKPLLIANSDQILEWDSNEFMYSMTSQHIDGAIVTFESCHPKWSFCKVDDDGYITEVAEKRPISNIANTGIYFWKKGSDFVKYAEQMIKNNIRVNNEFYVAPVFNEAIAAGLKFKNFNIEKMWGVGTPEDLEYYLSSNKDKL